MEDGRLVLRERRSGVWRARGAGLRTPLVVGLVVFGLLAAAPAARATMITAFQVSGHVGYELTGVASPGPPISASIPVTTLPPGAMPVAAFVYTNDFVGPMGTGGGQIDVALTPLAGPSTALAGNASPTSSDPVPIAQTFGWEIGVPPHLITGNGNYGIGINASAIGGNPNQMAGAGMLVIYSDPMLPQSTITVNHGVFMMGAGGMSNSQTTTFQQLTQPIYSGANSTLSLLTFADDAATSGEQILFNSSVIGGPIDANLAGGGSASIFNFNVTSVAGSSNTATLTSTGDVFGWHVAVLQTPIPEPSALPLFGCGALALLGAMRRRA